MGLVKRQPGERRWGMLVEYPLTDSDGGVTVPVGVVGMSFPGVCLDEVFDLFLDEGMGGVIEREF